MSSLPRKSLAKVPRKVTLAKSRASEILSGLHIAPSERQHAKRAIAAAKKAVAVHSRAAEASGKSELRVSVRAVRKSVKSKK
jgi:hypothetical protein